MFTGIIEKIGQIESITNHGSNLIFQIKAPGACHKLGESIAINGTCLTAIKFDQENFWVEAIPETLNLTNLGQLQRGDLVNLENSLKSGDSLDGHFVLGHIDFKTTVETINPDGESKRIWFKTPANYSKYIAKKGSICLNGVSLTISEVNLQAFEVCLIPYTLEHTNLGQLTINSPVNIEIDILARYLEKLINK